MECISKTYLGVWSLGETLVMTTALCSPFIVLLPPSLLSWLPGDILCWFQEEESRSREAGTFETPLW